jgi:hypothetical protein
MACTCFGLLLVCGYFSVAMEWERCGGNTAIIRWGHGVYPHLLPQGFSVKVCLLNDVHSIHVDRSRIIDFYACLCVKFTVLRCMSNALKAGQKLILSV